MGSELPDLIKFYWGDGNDPWRLIEIIFSNRPCNILSSCSRGAQIKAEELLLTFRKLYEKLAMPQTGLAVSKECDKVVQHLKNKQCKNFEELYNKYRSKAWEEATHKLVGEAMKGGMPLRYRGREDVEMITKTLRTMYSLASKVAHGGRPHISNIKVFCNNFLFLVLLGYYSKGPERLDC